MVSKSYNGTRAYRLNNPSNIRLSNSRWLGLAPIQDDKHFCTFVSVEYGVRALIALLSTYYNRYHLTSAREIISRFAPASDGNHTNVYIKYVSDVCAVGSDADLKLTFNYTSPNFNLFLLCKAICFQETNYTLNACVFKKALSML